MKSRKFHLRMLDPERKPCQRKDSWQPFSSSSHDNSFSPSIRSPKVHSSLVTCGRCGTLGPSGYNSYHQDPSSLWGRIIIRTNFKKYILSGMWCRIPKGSRPPAWTISSFLFTQTENSSSLWFQMSIWPKCWRKEELKWYSSWIRSRIQNDPMIPDCGPPTPSGLHKIYRHFITIWFRNEWMEDKKMMSLSVGMMNECHPFFPILSNGKTYVSTHRLNGSWIPSRLGIRAEFGGRH